MSDEPRRRRPIGEVLEDGSWAEASLTRARASTREAILHEPAILDAVRDELLRRLPPVFLDPFSPAGERYQAVAGVLRAIIAEQAQSGGLLGRLPNDMEMFRALYANTIGWKEAQKYLDDPKVNEIKINGTTILVQERGKRFVRAPESFSAPEEVRRRVHFLASHLDVRLDPSNPQETLPVKGGSRVHASIPPLIMDDGVLVCIRRGRTEAWDLGDLLKLKTISREIVELLQLFCRARCSFLIVGSTGSGKTGFLEALSNSWPGEMHIISIEDNAQEINIRRRDLWTRQLVDTTLDKLAFGRVAREALRQTPDLILPGEIRGPEAGAILDLALSDHPVITTIHGMSCREGVKRFVSYASDDQAYMYGGRRDDAMVDMCLGFQVVVKLDSWEELGLRLVSEIMLLDECEESAGGAPKPVLIPLVEQPRVDAAGEVSWDVHATAGADGMLVWNDGRERTPAMLRKKLQRAHAVGGVRIGATLTLVDQAVAEAEELLLARQPERALAVLTAAWDQRRDRRLVSTAQQVLAHGGSMFEELVAEAQLHAAELQRLLARRLWSEARPLYDRILAHLGWTTAAAPAEGWQLLGIAIQEGLAGEARVRQTLCEAETLVAAGQPQMVIETLRWVDAGDLPPALALPTLQLRAQAQEQLIALKQGSAQTLASLRAQITALQRQESQAS